MSKYSQHRSLALFRASGLEILWFRLLQAWNLKLNLTPEGSVPGPAARKLPTLSLPQVTDPQVNSRLSRFAQTEGFQATFSPYIPKRDHTGTSAAQLRPGGLRITFMGGVPPLPEE